MKESRAILDEVKKKINVKTDRELAAIMDINLHTLRNWIIRDNIPAERLIEISKQFGIKIGEIAVSYTHLTLPTNREV